MTGRADLVARLREVIAFLLGEAPLDGRWYGDESPRGEGHIAGYGAPYWWRTPLREAAGALRSSGEAVEELRGLRYVRDYIATSGQDYGIGSYRPNGSGFERNFSNRDDLLCCIDRQIEKLNVTPASAWRPKPVERGWHWHFDGDVMRMEFVFPRPGHAYLAVQDDANPVTGKRQFRVADAIGGQWYGPLPLPTPPTSTSGG